jgi:hypothetical protein
VIKYHSQPWLIFLLALLFYPGSQVYAEKPAKPARVDTELASPAGLLLNASPGGSAVPWCTVSLTRPDAVLTAFHCVTSTHSGDTLKVFFPDEGIREVDHESIEPFCLESDRAGKQQVPKGCSAWTDDLVILGLSTPYSLIQPFKPGNASAAGPGSTGAIAGFGYQDTNLSRYGIAHQGEIVLSDCVSHGDPADSASEDHGRALCFLFDGSKPAETGIGPFDSGGPMFSTDEKTGERTLIGIARGSEVVSGSNGDLRMAKYVNLTDPFYQHWLAEEAFSGNFVPAANSIEKLVGDEVQNLEPGKKADYTLEIRESSSRLILTLNHDPGPSMFPNNLNIQLPDSLEASCERHASVEVCSVENPPAGAYRMSVGWSEQCTLDGKCTDSVYEAAYQMTAIAVYDNPAEATGGTPATGSE